MTVLVAVVSRRVTRSAGAATAVSKHNVNFPSVIVGSAFLTARHATEAKLAM